MAEQAKPKETAKTTALFKDSFIKGDKGGLRKTFAFPIALGLHILIIGAMLVSVLFAILCDIMPWFWALLFGICFAFIGQLSDLAESLIKRDAEHKDSAASVPGFGGILDVIDSVLLAAPFAYLFFVMLGR